ncbi:hypothetical protein B4N89_16460 [Embleya scabrispora]|uniref:Uncharacterized protein n=2 Tax=Embleya scabrispora TaxID=159449 RepID=A0A1T3NZZ0_9ACTN|nr:hypothetical protein B4N89_16460 [Embleya scabrispora]
MAFSAHEVRVLRRALTVALRGGRDSVDFWLLGRAIGEAHDERERLRAFMTAELRRYRAALPGSAATFLSCLRNAVDEIAHVPSAEDLAALRTVVDLPCGERERASRAALLRRCTHLAEAALDQRLTARAHHRAAAEAHRATRPDPLDILIPGRPRVSHGTPAVVATRATRDREAPSAAPEPEAPRPTTPEVAVTEPMATEPRGTTPEAAEYTTTESTTPREATESEAAASEAPEPAGRDSATPEIAEDRTPELQAAPEVPELEAPESAAVAPRPSTTAESPPAAVIPHRRQGRVLGQLPAPDVLHTGTG